jgi:hypothetical protein
MGRLVGGGNITRDLLIRSWLRVAHTVCRAVVHQARANGRQSEWQNCKFALPSTSGLTLRLNKWRATSVNKNL